MLLHPWSYGIIHYVTFTAEGYGHIIMIALSYYIRPGLNWKKWNIIFWKAVVLYSYNKKYNNAYKWFKEPHHAGIHPGVSAHISKHGTLTQCWFNDVDGGATLNQHWINISCLLGRSGSICINDNRICYIHFHVSSFQKLLCSVIYQFDETRKNL